MSETDKSSKTEEATPQRLQQAHQRGQVAQSHELQVWATLVGAAVMLAWLIPHAARGVLEICRRFVERPEQLSVDAADARAGLAQLLFDLALTLAPVLLPLVVLGVAASLIQTGLIWTGERMKPDLGRLSPAKGWQRIASAHALIEFLKGLLKVAAVGAVLALIVSPLLPGLERWPSVALPGTLEQTGKLLVRMVAGVAALMTLVAGADFAYQRFSFLRQMRMTKQEVRDELKQSEGDPQIKARIRQLRQQRARSRMMAAIPDATVVITNPTHYAVALAYQMDAMAAPKVVAKGVDFLAARIREKAAASGVPVVENPPLARALHAAVEIDDEIPPEHYRAVAEIIGFVMRTRSGAGHAGG